jgi:CRISPR-associated protein Cmr6
MYPVVELKKNPDDLKTPIIKRKSAFLELLTIFPDDSVECNEFLAFLNTQPYGFKQLWGDK